MATDSYFAPSSVTMDGLTIRSYMPGDGVALQAATVSSYEHLRPWMAWATAEQSVEAAEAICRRCAARFLLNEDYTVGIWHGDRLVGGTGFHLRGHSRAARVADIGMWIRGDAAGQGLGTRALRVMLRWGFEAWEWERLTWQCDRRNSASAAVARRNGMTLEATLRSDALDVHGARRDTLLFAMLRDEWPRIASSAPAAER